FTRLVSSRSFEWVSTVLMMLPSTVLCLVAQARVDPHRDYVREQVKENNQHGKENGAAHNHGVVAVKRGLNKKAAKAGNLENGFHYKRAAQQSGKGGTQIGDDGNNTAAQCV